MEIVSTNALISINATFFAQLIFFLLFIFVLNFIMIRPIKKIGNNRNKYIVDIKNKIDFLNKKLTNISTDFSKSRKNILNESFETNNRIENQANLEVLNIYKKTKEKIFTFQTQFDKEINREVSKLKNDLYKDVGNITRLIMEKIIDRSLIK